MGESGCNGNRRCGETPAGEHFPRAQEWGNVSEENKVPERDDSGDGKRIVMAARGEFELRKIRLRAGLRASAN